MPCDASHMRPNKLEAESRAVAEAVQPIPLININREYIMATLTKDTHTRYTLEMSSEEKDHLTKLLLYIRDETIVDILGPTNWKKAIPKINAIANLLEQANS